MTPEQFADEIGAFRREIRGMARRMLVTLNGGAVWQTQGHTLLDASRPETRQVENWPGFGVFARPPASGAAEAIVLNIGGANNPAMIATRDEATRAAAVGDTDDDEANLYNSAARVYVRKDGTVEIRGVPNALPAEKMVKGETYRTAEDLYFAATEAMITTLLAAPPLAVYLASGAPLAAVTAYGLAVTAFHLAPATYLARVGKVE